MRSGIGCAAALLGMMGIVTDAAASENAAGVAEKRGLSPIIVLEAKASLPAKNGEVYSTIGVCNIAEKVTADKNINGANIVSVKGSAWEAIALHDPLYVSGGSFSDNQFTQEKLKQEGKFNYYEIDVNGATVRVLQQPKHGTLSIDLTQTEPYSYRPNGGFVGNDKAVFLVNMAGHDIKVVYFFKIPEGRLDSGNIEEVLNKYCPVPRAWLISGSPRTDHRATDLGSFNGLIKSAYAIGLLAGYDSYNYSAPKVTFSSLPEGAVGQTTGTGANASITLDTNAAGHGWFIDTTPGTNEEFLPTADSNVWQARAGSEAEGKMDMLSVLLHEYGHVLGVEHSADQHASMAATLTPGTRRLPTADELALMAQLIGQAKDELVSTSSNAPDAPQSPLPSLPFGLGFAAAFVGRSRSSGASLVPQYAVVANPTLTNPEFAGNTGWSTTGTVSLGNGAAVLTESATAQTRLNQIFVLGENDRFLRFTLDGIALGDLNGAPDDAFEVALNDANTGLSLLGGTGLTRSDAFLNLQADGSEHLASNVSVTLNADGSRTYLVDLSAVVSPLSNLWAQPGILWTLPLAGERVGVVASLSFDLIGFGRGASATTSTITVRDIKLGIPEAFDDAVTLAEDTPTIIAALSNDLDADQPGFAPAIVTAAAHGVVTINTDGTFGYTPDANYFGTDSFTYKISDSRVDSNIAPSLR